MATGNSSSNGWSEFISDPVPDLAPGIYDAFRSPGIAATQTETGFRVSFTWLGTGTPGIQTFDIVDSNTFETLESGITSLAQTSSVPEPGTLGLLLIGAIGLLGFRRKIR